MHEAALGVARLRPGVREQQKHAVQAGIGQGGQQGAGVVRPDQQVGRQRRGGRVGAIGHQARQQGGDAVLERFAGDQPGIGIRLDLRCRVLAAAEADFQPQPGRRRGEAGLGSRRIGHRQPRQHGLHQRDLARPQLVPARPTIQAVGRRALGGRGQRPKADFSTGTRSVRSQVNVPVSGSGSRPKWP